MNWLASLGVGLCAAPLTGIICGTAALACAEWLRIPQREGAAGYFALGMTLLGTLAGLIAGIGVARGWFGTQPGFGRSFGFTIASFTVIASVISAIVWITSDRPPKLQGRPLDLAVELRCPRGTALPDTATGHTPYVTLVRLSSGKSIGYASLDLDSAREIEGRLIVPALLRIESSAPRKLLNIRFSEQHDLLFDLEFGSKPSERNFEWSRWIEAAQVPVSRGRHPINRFTCVIKFSWSRSPRPL